MSFAFDFYASTHGDVLAQLDRLRPPVSVGSFIMSAVDNLRPLVEAKRSDDEEATGFWIYHVRATGHLMDTSSSYELSTAEIHVGRVFLTEHS